jgi:DNA-binding phage protein
MKDITFARQYLMELINSEDEAMSVEEALKFVIQRMGTTDFALFVGESKQTINKFLKGDRNPKKATIDKLLAPFGLKMVISIKPISA